MKHQAAAAALSGSAAADVAPPFWFATQDSGSEAQDELELAAAGQAKQHETCIIDAISFLQRNPAANSSSILATDQQPQQRTGLGGPASCFMRLLLKKEVATVAAIAAAAAGAGAGRPRRALQCVVDMWPALPHADFLTILDEESAPAAAVAAEQLKQPTLAAAAATGQRMNQQQQQQDQVEAAAAAPPAAAAVKAEQPQHCDAAVQQLPKPEPVTSPEQPRAAIKPEPVFQDSAHPAAKSAAAPGAVALPNAAATAAAAAAAAAASGSASGGRRRARATAGKRDDDFEYDLAGEEDDLLGLLGAAAGSGGKAKRRCGDAAARGGVPETMQANRLKLKVC
jgi:outer membrane biosynthesis protein TonB